SKLSQTKNFKTVIAFHQPVPNGTIIMVVPILLPFVLHIANIILVSSAMVRCNIRKLGNMHLKTCKIFKYIIPMPKYHYSW
ncbi:MAG: hypothetical protein ACYC2P_12335, partial [Paludibacteraceae bacterium]